MAEGVGFEPTVQLPVHGISSAAPSATRPPLRTLRQSPHASTARPSGAGALRRRLEVQIKWRRGEDLNPRGTCAPIRFRVGRLQPGSATPPRHSRSFLLKELASGAPRTPRFARRPHDRHLVIQPRVLQQPVQRPRGARLRIRRAVDDARDARIDRGAAAHRARLHRRVQLGADEPVVAHSLRRISQRDDLRMRRRIGRPRSPDCVPGR